MLCRLLILVIVLSVANFGMVSAMSTLMTGAHSIVVKELDDITTLNTKDMTPPGWEDGRISAGVNDWIDGKPVRAAWNVPSRPVPGYLITGMYEDAKFIFLVPKNWNGKLVTTGTGGLREETAELHRWGDYVLTHFDANGASYAYAATDKGTRGEFIPDYNSGETSVKRPGVAHLTFLNVKPDPKDPAHNDSLEEWVYRIRQLTMGAKEALVKLKGKAPERTYVVGTSNGGYVARRALETNDDYLFDGGIDWEGGSWGADDPVFIMVLKDLTINGLTYNNPNATPEERAKAKTVMDKWLAPEAEFLWNNPRDNFYWYMWKINLDAYIAIADPEYAAAYYGLPSGKISWIKLGTDNKAFSNWDFSKRPASVQNWFRNFAVTGKINKPLISVVGTWDALIMPNASAIPYRAIIEKNGKGDIHRLYLIEHGTHMDGWVGDPMRDPGKKLTNVMPYAHQAFNLLEEWVEHGKVPPANKTIPVPQTYGKAIDLITGNEVDPY